MSVSAEQVKSAKVAAVEASMQSAGITSLQRNFDGSISADITAPKVSDTDTEPRYEMTLAMKSGNVSIVSQNRDTFTHGYRQYGITEATITREGIVINRSDKAYHGEGPEDADRNFAETRAQSDAALVQSARDILQVFKLYSTLSSREQKDLNANLDDHFEAKPVWEGFRRIFRQNHSGDATRMQAVLAQ